MNNVKINWIIKLLDMQFMFPWYRIVDAVPENCNVLKYHVQRWGIAQANNLKELHIFNADF